MFDAPQIKRLRSEMTERDALRTAEAWLADHEQNERLARMTPRQTDPIAAMWAKEAREFVLLVACAFVVLFAFLSIG